MFPTSVAAVSETGREISGTGRRCVFVCAIAATTHADE
jgi:hypothetical protein